MMVKHKSIFIDVNKSFQINKHVIIIFMYFIFSIFFLLGIFDLIYDI